MLSLFGRNKSLVIEDLENYDDQINKVVKDSHFLIIGAAGTIGQAVTREIFKRKPSSIHAVDINENNLVELVRDIRSSLGYICPDFRTYAIDCDSPEFEALCKNSHNYDFVLNLSALKHVRSEKDPFTLMRMIHINILNTVKTLKMSQHFGARKYFCVSTDKAANPVNMMGASKTIMEMFLQRESNYQMVSTARFANVAFSDGSLLHGFRKRIEKKQPLSAPKDIKRYFITPQESGEICLLSTVLGANKEIFIPKFISHKHLHTFSDIAVRFIEQLNFEPFECQSEEEARERANELIEKKRWPCFFFNSDTTGEKNIEEFYSENEKVNFSRFASLGVIQNSLSYDSDKLDKFLLEIQNLRLRKNWTKADLLELFFELIPSFKHKETGKYLDDKM